MQIKPWLKQPNAYFMEKTKPLPRQCFLKDTGFFGHPDIAIGNTNYFTHYRKLFDSFLSCSLTIGTSSPVISIHFGEIRAYVCAKIYAQACLAVSFIIAKKMKNNNIDEAENCIGILIVLSWCRYNAWQYERGVVSLER